MNFFDNFFVRIGTSALFVAVLQEYLVCLGVPGTRRYKLVTNIAGWIGFISLIPFFIGLIVENKDLEKASLGIFEFCIVVSLFRDFKPILNEWRKKKRQ